MNTSPSYFAPRPAAMAPAPLTPTVPAPAKSYGFWWFLLGLLAGAAFVWFFKERLKDFVQQLVPLQAKPTPAPAVVVAAPAPHMSRTPFESEADKTAATIDEAQADDFPERMPPKVMPMPAPKPKPKPKKPTNTAPNLA